MISTSDLVNTVSQSTAAYLALLRANGKGRKPMSLLTEIANAD